MKSTRLRVAKWGNSLAVRLPIECSRATGLRAGDSVEARISPEGEITLVPAPVFDRTAFLERAKKLRATMPMTDPVVEKMRQESRY